MCPFRSVIVFLYVWCVSAVPYSPKDLDEAKAKEVFQCIDEVSCEEKKPLEIRAIAESVKDSPEALRDVYEATSAYGFLPQPTDESWIELSESICKMPYAERLSCFSSFGTTFGDHYSKHGCENPETQSDYCTAIDQFFVTGQAFIDKWTDLGVCNNPERIARQTGTKMPVGGMLG